MPKTHKAKKTTARATKNITEEVEPIKIAALAVDPIEGDAAVVEETPEELEVAEDELGEDEEDSLLETWDE